MIHYIVTLFLVLGAFCSHAQTVNLSGTISNPDGDPVSGAIVTLKGLDIKDTTGSNGMYTLSQTISGISHSSLSKGIVSVSGNILEFNLSQPSQLTIEIFDIKSNLLKVDRRAAEKAGVFRWNIPGEYPSNQLLIIRAWVGEKVSTLRYMPLTGGTFKNRSGNNFFSYEGAEAKAAAAVDSLEVMASGYATKVVEVESYEGTLDVSLNAADKWGGIGNPPAKSSGCGKPASITTGDKTIMSGGRQRQYMIDVPSNYDQDKPYRLIYASHGRGGEDEHVANWWNYFGLKTEAEKAGEPAIFIAPQSFGAEWGESDHALFDDITDLAKGGLCVDTTRIFITGMSFGGMISYSLSTNHQDKIRAAVGLAPVNYNIYLPNPKLSKSIAWMQTTGMSDRTCPWVSNESQKTGSKFIALEKAADNGCTVPSDIRTWQNSDPTRHICVDLEGCKEGYPVKVCTFNGGHWQFPWDGGNNENLEQSWVPVESWKFFTQF